MVNGNSYPLSSVCGLARPRTTLAGQDEEGVVATSEGETARPIRSCATRCSISLRAIPRAYWHRPTVVRDMKSKLGDVIGRMKVVAPERPGDDVIDNDLILVWGPQRRIITGADLLGRLLRDIVTLEGEKAASLPSRDAS